MKRVGLVLGAGGVVGQAYHSGVLAALEHDLGWDPRTAEVIVGTSAGSITGALLRNGVPASELAAWSVRAPLSAEGALLEQLFGSEHPEFAPFDAAQGERVLKSTCEPGRLSHSARGIAGSASRACHHATFAPRVLRAREASISLR